MDTIPLTEPSGMVSGPNLDGTDGIYSVGPEATRLLATVAPTARAMPEPELCPAAGCGEGVARVEADGVPDLWLCEACLQSFTVMAAAVVAIRRYTTPAALA